MTKYLLHIDTASDTGTVAVAGDGKVIASRTSNESRNHASIINIMIADVLAEAQITFKELSAIVACGGPGSYTGLRIGMATAKGLCYALDIPLIMDSRLALLAYQAYLKKEAAYTQYISLLTARDKEYFISIYDHKFQCTLPPRHIAEEELKQIVAANDNIHLTTDAPESVINSLNVNNLKINTDINIHVNPWALYAFEEYKCNSIVNLATAEPFYLKQVYTHK